MLRLTLSSVSRVCSNEYFPRLIPSYFPSCLGIMSEIKDNFIKILDNSQCGIVNMMNNLMEMLKANDLQLYQSLSERNIKPQVF